MKNIVTVMLVIVLSAVQVWAGSVGDSVEVRIATDSGLTLPTYPLRLRSNIKKVYAEAVKGDNYRIEVRNRLDRRVGVVIAVDGRNIISGGKSWLKSSERMYILEPYGAGEFSGWRATDDRINRFYFTAVADSYAAAFGDKSAMGVISVAVYPEVQRYQSQLQSQWAPEQEYNRAGRAAGSADRVESSPAAPAPAAESSSRQAAKAERKSMDSAGTGYGYEEYSPVQTVVFAAEKRAVEIIHFKYEWRSTLCKLGVTGCDQPPRRYSNRFWDNGGYAPPPPGRL